MSYLLVSNYVVLEAKRSICDILIAVWASQEKRMQVSVPSLPIESVASQNRHGGQQGYSCIVPAALVKARHIYAVEHFLLTRHKESEYRMIL